jgi:hypothetical protein
MLGRDAGALRIAMRPRVFSNAGQIRCPLSISRRRGRILPYRRRRTEPEIGIFVDNTPLFCSRGARRAARASGKFPGVQRALEQNFFRCSKRPAGRESQTHVYALAI